MSESKLWVSLNYACLDVSGWQLPGRLINDVFLPFLLKIRIKSSLIQVLECLRQDFIESFLIVRWQTLTEIPFIIANGYVL